MRKRIIACWTAIAFAFLPAATRAQPPPKTETSNQRFQHGVELYEHGDYALAAKELADLLSAPEVGFDSEKIRRAHLYRGISLFLTDDREGADREFWLVLNSDPEFKPDPLFTPPAVTAAFTRLKHDNAEELRKIPRLPKKNTEIARDPLGIPLGRGPGGQITVRGDFFRSIAPFGFAQFHNEQPGKAYAILGIETVLLTANLSSAASYYSLRKRGGRFEKPDDRDEFRNAGIARSVNQVSFALLLATLLYGSADGLWSATRGPAKPPELRPLLGPGPGQAGLTLTWRF